MRNIWSLLKMQLDNKTNLLKMASPRAMIPALLKALLIIVLETFVVSFALSKVFNLGFSINAELLALIFLVTQLLSLVFAVGNVINTMYLCKDNEMLICLPVTPDQLFISKLLMIYIKEVAVNAAITLPILITLGSFSRPDICFYLFLPVLVILMPVLPISVAAFISMPIMSIIRFLKKHVVLSITVVFGLISACLWGYISLIGNVATEFNIADKQYETVLEVNKAIGAIGKNIPLYFQLGKSMFDPKLGYYFLVYLALCLGIAVAAIFFTRHFFFKLAMTNLEKTVKVKPKIKNFKKRSRFISLFQKEFFCVFRSSTEIFEYFLFTILMPFIVFSYDRLLSTIANNITEEGVDMIAGAHVMVVAILAMLSNISSASAISRDGGNFHTSKTIPVDYFTQMFVKFSFNAVFTIGAVALTAAISMFIYPAWQIIMGSIAVAMAAVGHIAYSIACDVKKPTISAVGDEEASTVSKSTSKCLIVGILIGFILGIIVMLMSGVGMAFESYILITVLSFLYMLNRIVNLILRINHNYDKIEM